MTVPLLFLGGKQVIQFYNCTQRKIIPEEKRFEKVRYFTYDFYRYLQIYKENQKKNQTFSIR